MANMKVITIGSIEKTFSDKIKKLYIFVGSWVIFQIKFQFTIAAVVLILAASVSATVVKYHLAPSVRYVSPWVTTRNVVVVNPWESHVALTRGLPYVPIVPYHIPVTHISVPVAHIEPPVITAIPTHGA